MKEQSHFGVHERQRIGASMLGAAAPASLAHEAVLGMEMDLLQQGWPVGQALGALREVKKRLDLGRPASREAVTILQARGLLDVRRGPGGGMFVAAPPLEDVAGAILMHLALTGKPQDCIEEFRLIVWRMIVRAAIRRRVAPPPPGAKSGPWGFAADLAEQAGNSIMELLARLAEMLTLICREGKARAGDDALEAVIGQGDLAEILERLEGLAGPAAQEGPSVALEVAVRSFSLSGRKSAMALAARMTRELSDSTGPMEAEWQTADRLGYTDAVVRQARRVLQDFGIVRCHQGRRGTELAPSASPTGAIRMLAPCLVASTNSALDIQEALSFLVSSAPALAARRAGRAGSHHVGLSDLVPSPDPLEAEAVGLENLLLELSGNPLLVIAVRALGIAFIMETDSVSPPDRGYVIAINRRILQAIEAGDSETAAELARVKFETMQRSANRVRKTAEKRHFQRNRISY